MDRSPAYGETTSDGNEGKLTARRIAAIRVSNDDEKSVNFITAQIYPRIKTIAAAENTP
jgi:hypothetical protein